MIPSKNLGQITNENKNHSYSKRTRKADYRISKKKENQPRKFKSHVGRWRARTSNAIFMRQNPNTDTTVDQLGLTLTVCAIISNTWRRQTKHDTARCLSTACEKYTVDSALRLSKGELCGVMNTIISMEIIVGNRWIFE